MPSHSRFSARKLIVITVLASAYFAAWELTQRHCDRDNLMFRQDTGDIVSFDSTSRHGFAVVPGGTIVRVGQSFSPVPFVIAESHHLMTFTAKPMFTGQYGVSNSARRAYYLWLFGPRFKFFEHRTRA